MASAIRCRLLARDTPAVSLAFVRPTTAYASASGSGCPCEARREAPLLRNTPTPHLNSSIIYIWKPWSRPASSRPWTARMPSTLARAAARCASYTRRMTRPLRADTVLRRSWKKERLLSLVCSDNPPIERQLSDSPSLAAGNRWHIDCFRCNTCGTLLDSDANLLLLGDGSLICNNCTYSCNACGNKIEDLAILTGDQAFCASCFRCRNCKRKIENLRYARTSQGIFCMSCHESLMARRRKKNKGARSVTGGTNGPGSTTTTTTSTPAEKALPSLPPGAASEAAFSPEMETPPTDTPGGKSTTRTLRSEKDALPSHYKRGVSPLSDEIRRGGFTCAQWLKPYLIMADTFFSSSRRPNSACEHLQRRSPFANVVHLR